MKDDKINIFEREMILWELDFALSQAQKVIKSERFATMKEKIQKEVLVWIEGNTTE